jgi:hypothetical protein
MADLIRAGTAGEISAIRPTGPVARMVTNSSLANTAGISAHAAATTVVNIASGTVVDLDSPIPAFCCSIFFSIP